MKKLAVTFAFACATTAERSASSFHSRSAIAKLSAFIAPTRTAATTSRM